jgi:hypothetical protein
MVWVWVGLSIAGLAVAGFRGSAKAAGSSERGRDLLVYASTAFVLGAAGFMGFVRMVSLPSQPWYYLPLLAFSAVCLEAIFATFAAGSSARRARIAIVVVLAALATPKTWQGVHVRATNIDRVAAHLAGNASKSDLIVVSPWYFGVSFLRRFRGTTPWMTVPPIEDLSVHRYDLLKEQMMAKEPLRPLLDAVGERLRSGGRVWWVGNIAFPDDRAVPRSPPPAPNGPGGWNNGYYLDAWTLQAGHFLRSHARTGNLVNLHDDAPVSSYENPSVLVFEGWRP